MTLPTNPNTPITDEARRDEIYNRIKHHLPTLKEKSSALKDELVKLVLEDMSVDHAIASAVDEIGEVLEYQAQAEGIERPRFNGSGLLKDVERISKLDFSLRLSSLLGLDEHAVDAIREAEIERLWGDNLPNREKKDAAPQLRLPDEFYGMLRDISKALTKRTGNGTGTPRGPTNRPTGSVNRPSGGTGPNRKAPS